MGATIREDGNGVWLLRISGALRKEEMDAVQADGKKALGAAGEAKMLVVVSEDFSGWVGGEAWGDMSFFVEYGDRIVKIAVVCDRKWESEMLMFAGAGLRRAPVKCFPPDRLAEARAWLGQ